MTTAITIITTIAAPVKHHAHFYTVYTVQNPTMSFAKKETYANSHKRSNIGIDHLQARG